MKKKDILFLLQFFYPEYVSSATLPFDVAVRLVEEGFSVDVMTGYPREYTELCNVPLKETVNGINIKRVRYLQPSRKRALGRTVNFLSLTVALTLRLFEMRKYKAVIVYSNPPVLPWLGAMVKKLFKCKLVFVAFDLYPEIALKTNALSQNGIVTKVMNRINETVYKLSDAVVCLSDEMKSFIVKNRCISQDKVHVIPNWHKDERDEKGKKESSFQKLTRKRLTVGYFGNMGVAQNMNPLLDAVSHFNNDGDLAFLIAGHGSKKSDIEQKILDEKIDNAHLFGFLRGQDYIDALASCDVALVTLEKGLDGLCSPSKTSSYMMMGLPIIDICANANGITELNEGYRVADSKSLIELIEYLKVNPDRLSEKSAASRSIYEKNFTPKLCLDKYIDLLKSLNTLNKGEKL